MKQNDFTLEMPPKLGTRSPIKIQSNNSIIFVGANGSGKTRLGTWIEFNSPQKGTVHRISAQKSLSMPDSTTPMSIELAERNLLFGNPDPSSNKKVFKWGHKPATFLLNDYEKLMIYLFSDETESNAKYKAEQKATLDRVDPPTTKLDKLKNAWETILPHRELVVGGLRIQTRVKDTSNKIYNSSEMSDGERVIFYLIGQCLAAPENGILVIDEPELHLHKSIQIPLWAEVEKLRDDCLFVYLTHDVDFAASHDGATKVWLKSFDGDSWEWEEIQSSDTLPNELLIEVLGSRKPVVFVEGENGSYDVALYRELLGDFLVIPRGSCIQVIQSVKALRANTQLHHLDVYGLIDRDRRSDPEIISLKENFVFVLEVAEVENLFCTEELIKLVSSRLERDPTEDFNRVSDLVFRRLQSEIEKQISLRCANEIKFKLNYFDESACGEQKLKDAVNTLVEQIDVAAVYSQSKNKFEEIVNTKNYAGLLKLYNRKSLSSQVGNAIGLANQELPKFVLRLARSEYRNEVKNCLLEYFGDFAEKIA